ncbi:2-C-methyl-D-erythritol 4-phosphate cytidylyltransferase [uncultured Microbulbifer sp.]|uniref:2-C-methyl-D-erythritol 4-phosphate cytidylyltransferase n=1 Tax=uncultured Microbulbifer sp. TaxID=348147 RepID=UPI002624E214|nr:2-C-methyl-D-erythritol 4-phosphate cytidylyltransferase [uncultured Microbulbifer sp.]
MVDVILLAAGVGSRAKRDLPKQFIRVSGKPLFIHTIEVVSQVKAIENIILAINESYRDIYVELLEKYSIENVALVAGGQTRQESVLKALEHVQTNEVFIHEAARPYIVKKDFDSLIEAWEEELGCVVPVIKIPFTVSIGGTYMEAEVERESLRNIQLPQLFSTGSLKVSHQRAHAENYDATEDSMLAFHYGKKVKFIDGRESNVKVTTPYDLHIAELTLSHKSQLIEEYK